MRRRDIVAIPRTYLEFCVRQTSGKHQRRLKRLLRRMDRDGPYGLSFKKARK